MLKRARRVVESIYLMFRLFTFLMNVDIARLLLFVS